MTPSPRRCRREKIGQAAEQVSARSYCLGEDYPAINALFEAHGWKGGVPKACMPPTGFVAEHEGRIVASSSVFLAQEAAFALITFTVVAVDVRGAVRMRALNAVLERVIALGRHHVGPQGLIVSFTANKGLQAVYARHGLAVGERGVASFYLPVGDLPVDFMSEDAPPTRPA